MNPGEAIWVAEWRMNRTGLGDPFGPKMLYRRGSYERKTPRGMSGSKIGDSLTKNHSFVPLCKEVLRGVELMGRRAEDADEPTKAD